jgi:hypothetical protein
MRPRAQLHYYPPILQLYLPCSSCRCGESLPGSSLRECLLSMLGRLSQAGLLLKYNLSNIVFTFAATFQSVFAAGWNSTSYANNAGHAHPKAAPQIPIEVERGFEKRTPRRHDPDPDGLTGRVARRCTVEITYFAICPWVSKSRPWKLPQPIGFITGGSDNTF